jgi:hypothetical protein
MPVQETTDSIEELSRLGLPVGCVIVNAARTPLLDSERVTETKLRRGLVAAGLPTGREVVAGLVTEVKAHQTRLTVERDLRAELAGLGRPVVELPLLADGVTPEGLEVLAAALLNRTS